MWSTTDEVRLKRLEKAVAYLACQVKNGGGGGEPLFLASPAYTITQSDIDFWNQGGSEQNLQTVTDAGSQTTNSILSLANIGGNTLSVTSQIDPSFLGVIQGNNLFGSQNYELPDQSGTFILDTDIPIYIQGSVGEVGFFVGNSIMRGDSNYKWDSTNKRLAVGVTSPTTSIDTNTLRARSLPNADGDATFTRIVVQKPDGTFGNSARDFRAGISRVEVNGTTFNESSADLIVFYNGLPYNYNIAQLVVGNTRTYMIRSLYSLASGGKPITITATTHPILFNEIDTSTAVLIPIGSSCTLVEGATYTVSFDVSGSRIYIMRLT